MIAVWDGFGAKQLGRSWEPVAEAGIDEAAGETCIVMLWAAVAFEEWLIRVGNDGGGWGCDGCV